MGQRRNAYNARRVFRHDQRVSDENSEDRIRVPRTYLAEDLSNTEVKPIVKASIRAFIGHKYDNVDRNLPAFLVRNDLFDELARRDFASMMQNDDLAVTPAVAELMFMQSIPGHAASGHGLYRDKARFPNANAEWVYKALGVDAAKMRQARQVIIDDIFDYANRILKDPLDPRVRRAVNRNNDPLAGSYVMAGVEIEEPTDILIGMYLASRMDNFEWRSRVRERFGLEMGGGKNYAVNLIRMLEEKMTLEDLSTREYSKEGIADLVAKGLIIDATAVNASDEIINGYVRLRVGFGVSDDAGVITSGLKFGRRPPSKYTAIGLGLGDAVDTHDKHTPKIYAGGQDELLGDMIYELAEERGIELPTDEQVEEFIYLTSINPMRVTLYPDCSQRRFHMNMVSEGSKIRCALEHHLAFIDKVRAAKLQEYDVAMARIKKQDCEDDHVPEIVSERRYSDQLDMSSIPNGQILRKMPDLKISFRGVSSKAFLSTYVERYNKSHREDGLINN